MDDTIFDCTADPNESQIEDFLIQFQQLMIAKRKQKHGDNIDVSRRRMMLLFDFVFAAVLTISISFASFGFVNVKKCPTNFKEFFPFRGQCFRISNETYS